MSMKVSLEVPEAPNRYWYLFWIEKIVYLNKHRKIKVTFINKISPNNYLNDLDREHVYIIKLSVSNLADLSIGLIYDSIDNCFIKPEFSKKISCSNKKSLNSTIKPFPIRNILFPKENSNQIFEGLNYYIFYGKRFKLNYNVIISPYVLLQYFLYNSDRLILKAITGTLLDSFKLANLKFYKDRETKERVVELYYDNSKIKKNEAYILAPLFFLKNKIGLNFLKSIYSQILNSFLNQNNKDEIKSYLKVDWKFENYSILLNGEDFNDVEIGPEQFKNYFLVHRIVNFKFDESNPFIIDKIILTPYNSKNSTKDRENHEAIPVERPKKPKSGSLLLKLNKDVASSKNTVEKVNRITLKNPYNVKIEHIDREEQLNSYDVIPINTDEVIEGLVRETEEFNDEIGNIRENIINEEKKLENINNLDYFNRVLDVLPFFSKDDILTINRNLFGEGDENFYSGNHNNYLKIAEIFYKNIYIYLVEFGNGIIGIFTSIYLNKIEIGVLDGELIKYFFIYKKIIDDKNQDKLLWTFIYENKKDFLKIDNKINIIQGVKHKRKLEIKNDIEKDLKDKDEDFFRSIVIKETASNLFKKINNIS